MGEDAGAVTPFEALVRRRRMVREYEDRPVPPALVDRLLDLARRVPSAGFSQGFEFVVLEGPAQTARFWDRTLPVEKRATFPWPGLLRAPVVVLPLADPQAYVERYAQPDKARTGLGEGADRWSVPYWFVDTAFAVEHLLLGAVEAGLGALFFGIFDNEAALLADLGVPDGVRAVGAVTLGWPTAAALAVRREGSPRTRPRRSLDSIVHRGGW